MTIVAGFKGSESIAVAADTQETVGEHLKISVPKLKDHERQKWCVVLGGAGNAKLIDLLFEKIEGITGLISSTAGFRERLEEILEAIYKKHIFSAPADLRDYLEFELVIGLWTKNDGLALLETSHALTLACTRGYSCIGWGASHAKKLADEWYEASFSRDSLVLLANYILQQTKKYEPHCGGETHVMSIGSDGLVEVHEPEESRDDETFADAFAKIEKWPFFWCGNEKTSEELLASFATAYAEMLKLLHAMRKQQKENREVLSTRFDEYVKQLIARMSKPKP